MPKIYDNNVLRDMTAEEESQAVIESEADEKDRIARKVITDKTIADKASGNQKLKDLGLTDDEITALVG